MIVSARYGVLEEILKQERSHGNSASAAEEPQTQSRSPGMPPPIAEHYDTSTRMLMLQCQVTVIYSSGSAGCAALRSFSPAVKNISSNRGRILQRLTCGYHHIHLSWYSAVSPEPAVPELLTRGSEHAKHMSTCTVRNF